jgi:hypothetical protein
LAHLLVRLHVVLAGEARVVVVYLVIVPGDDPGRGRVRSLERRVAFRLRVADAVLLDRADLGRRILAGAIVDTAVLVDVVAEMRDEVNVLLRHVVVRGEVPFLELLAARKCQTQW